MNKMNTATENLEDDHVSILRLTDIILAMVENRSDKIEHFELVVNLIRKFADGLHHAKEENLLFPLLGEKGFSPEIGPVAVMLNEHEQGRNFVRAALDGIDEFKNGKHGELQTIYENLGNYATLLQNHISKENNILFRMADQVLSDREQQNLLVQFAEVEGNTELEFNPENSKQKIDELAVIYL
jgi:hemerythrin-like domain-containing protein